MTRPPGRPVGPEGKVTRYTLLLTAPQLARLLRYGKSPSAAVNNILRKIFEGKP